MIHKVVRLTSESLGVVDIFSEIDELMNSLYPAELNILLSTKEVDDDNVEFYGVYCSDQLAACGAVVFKRDADEPYGELKRMYVKPSYRGLGLSKKILSHLITLIIDKGFNKVMLETGIRQREAIALYRHFGFYECECYGEYKPDPQSMFMQLYVADKSE